MHNHLTRTINSSFLFQQKIHYNFVCMFLVSKSIATKFVIVYMFSVAAKLYLKLGYVVV